MVAAISSCAGPAGRRRALLARSALPTLPGPAPPCGCTTPRAARCVETAPGRTARHVRLRHHPLRRHPPRPRRHLPRLRPGQPGVAGRRHEVHYVQNVTDVDDPLLERADRDGEDWMVLAMRETALFREDMAALRVLPPEHYVGAVEAIPQIVGQGRGAAGRGAGLPARRRHRRRLLRRRAGPRLRLRVRLRRGDDAAAVRRARRRPRPARASATRSTRCCGAAPATGSRPGPAARWAPGGRAGTSSAPSSRWTRLGTASTCRAAAAT